MLLTFLAQQKAESPATEIGELLFYGGIAILVVVLVVSGIIVREAHRNNYVNAGAVGLLMFGSVLGPLILLQLTVARLIEPGMLQSVAVIGGVVVWVGTLLWYTVVSSQMKRRDEAAEEEERREELFAIDRGPDPDLVDEVIDANDPPAAGLTPRRAISIPAAESDSGRASEQTLKRMTLEKLEESNSGAPKPPRAGEIPENPILPDEVVKVRCLACDKKMQAEGPKFMKQRRCPNCKAEPFRYVTAV